MRDQCAAVMSSREIARQWFIPGDGIDRTVISADIQRYLGNDATVRPGMGTGENDVSLSRPTVQGDRHTNQCTGSARLLDQGISEFDLSRHRSNAHVDHSTDSSRP